MQTDYTNAATGHSATSRRHRIILSDFNGTLAFAGGGMNGQELSILKRSLAIGDRVIVATGADVQRMKTVLQSHFSAEEFKAIEFFDKAELSTEHRQSQGLEPIIPDIIFDDAPKIDYLSHYGHHAQILTPDLVTLGAQGGKESLCSYEDIAKFLELPDVPAPAPQYNSPVAPKTSLSR